MEDFTDCSLLEEQRIYIHIITIELGTPQPLAF